MSNVDPNEATPESVTDTLRRIAENNATDTGTLARLLLSEYSDDSSEVQGDTDMAELSMPRAGERRYGEDGQLYEYKDDGGWFIVADNQTADDTGDTPADPHRVSFADTEKDDGTNIATDPVTGETTDADRPSDSTPPWSGNPDAPNTTVDEGSAEGPEV